MKNLYLPVIAAASIFLFSCKKDSTVSEQPQSNLNGNWNLLSIEVNGETSTKITTEEFGSMTSVATMDYLTTNNKGILAFTQSTVKSINLVYDVTGTFGMKQYMDDVFIGGEDSTVNIHHELDEEEETMEGSYTRVGADSIYCPEGFVIFPQGIDEGKPMGAKLRFDGDKVFMTFINKESTSTNDDGITNETKNDVTMVIALQKK